MLFLLFLAKQWVGLWSVIVAFLQVTLTFLQTLKIVFDLANSAKLVTIYSKTCVNSLSKIDKTKVLMTNGSLMKVESIEKCSPSSILQYF